jgi:hypothetical protein
MNSRKEMKKIIPFTIAAIRMKFLGINLKKQKMCTLKTTKHF